jgi:solute carrier family 25 carnitine/acylcarnitine transporter 20/29
MQTGGGGGAGTFKLLQTTFANEGMTGLYRGVTAPILAIAPVFAVCFWGYDMGKRVVRAMSVSSNTSSNASPEEQPMTISQLSLAGALSAIPTTAIMAPSERIKCLLQVQANEIAKGGVAKYTGVTDCAMQVYKEGGLRSVFKGSFVTVRSIIKKGSNYAC